jgi:Bifunctional DNA primase/polymerase, N-terminal
MGIPQGKDERNDTDKRNGGVALMMGELSWFSQIIGAAPEGEIEANARIAKALIRAGLAVVIIESGSKLPACTLLTKDAKKADTEAQDAAKEAGNPNWEKVKHGCGIKHALTDEKALTRKRIKDLFASGANLAIAPGVGERRLMAVDIDTSTQWDSFLEEWTDHIVDSGEEGAIDWPRTFPLTVTSPGVMKVTASGGENWIHKNGGHFWMEYPEDAELPTRPGKMTWCACHQMRQPKGGCEKAWAVYWNSGYVLVPPSVRPEGAYRLTGSALEAPYWLLDLIRQAPAPGAGEDGSVALHTDSDDPIDIWSAKTSWDTLLTADDFTPADSDNCGCPTYTRPGAPAHTKSVTAHEVGCGQYDTSMGHGPLHIWSDALGTKTISKLTYVAQEHYAGDFQEAMTALGIERTSKRDELDELDDLEDGPKKGDAPEHGADDGEELDELDDLGPIDEVVDTWKKVDLSGYLDGSISQPIPTLMPREDGKCLVYPGAIHSFHGESESGKSLILMWEAVRLMQAGHDVLWITFDSDPAEDVGRAIKYGCPPAVVAEHLDYRKPDASHIGSEGFIDMFHRPYALAVIDGVTDALNLLGKGMTRGDPNDAYTQFSRIFPKRLADKTGAAVVLVDHVSKDADNRGRFAIGAQAKMSQLTGAAYLVEPERPPVRGGKGTVVLRVAKDRPGSVRNTCGAWRQRDRTQEAARIQIDDTGANTTFVLEAPNAGDPFDNAGGVDRPEQIMTQVSELLEGQPKGLSARAIREAISGRNERIGLALEILINEGYVEIQNGATRSKIHVLVKPYGLDIIEPLEPEVAE